LRILTLDNKSFDLNNLPDEVDDSMRFAVLDNSNPNEPDFFFQPLIFLESFNAPAMVLKIGEQVIQVPLDWCIVVGCKESGNDLEVIPLTSITDRGFDCFLFNPMTSYTFNFNKVEIINIYMDVKWYFPKMKTGQILAIPLTDELNPLCAFFVKEVGRQSEVIQYSKLM
jgi:hypothetical protein